jgi:ankyrin repeat protein
VHHQLCVTLGSFYRTSSCSGEIGQTGCDIDEEDENGARPLHYASIRGNATIVELLLSKGANVNTQGGYYGNALQAASCNSDGGTAIVELLLSKGADVNAL